MPTAAYYNIILCEYSTRLYHYVIPPIFLRPIVRSLGRYCMVIILAMLHDVASAVATLAVLAVLLAVTP